MSRITIENIQDFHHINDQIICCVGRQMFSKSTKDFAKGIEFKHAWLRKQIETYGEVGKIAYKGTEPVGFLEFVPGKIAPLDSREKDSCVYIDCYYVLQNEQNTGVGSALTKSTVKEFSKGHPWFQGKPAESIKLLAFEKSHWKNAVPFHRLGFKTETRWIYGRKEREHTPVLLTLDIKPKKRETNEIAIRLPTQKYLPVMVKVFRSIPCPFGSPDFPEVRKTIKKFGNKAQLEILDLWENPELVRTYGPNPGTVVNDQLVWASPNEYVSRLETMIEEQLQILETNVVVRQQGTR